MDNTKKWFKGVYIDYLKSLLEYGIYSSYEWFKNKVLPTKSPKNEENLVESYQKQDNLEQFQNDSPEEREIDDRYKRICEIVKQSDLFSILNQQQQLILYGFKVLN